ncbi:MAG: hypothetical protein ACI837_001374 [Crocinitomicaceae bacterium]|jgi:hypothetical protein
MWKKRLLRITKWFFGIILSLVLLITALLYFFKDDICDMVIAEVNQYLKTEVSVSDVDLSFWGSFPNLSVDFNDVFIKDAIEGATIHDTLLYSERIRLKFNPMDFWRENYTVKAIEVSPGTLKLKVNEEGLQNYDILKDREDQEGKDGVDVNLSSIKLLNFSVSYANKVTDQVYRTLLDDMVFAGELSSSAFTSTAVSNLKILEARSGNVTLIKNQPATLNIAVNVNQDSNTVTIPLSTIYISGLPFTFKGNVDSTGYSFNVDGEKIQIADAASRFSVQETADVKKFEGRGSLLFKLHVHGKSKSNSAALIHCAFGVDGGHLTDPSSGLSLKQLKLDGEYSNEEGKENEFLQLRDVSFQTKGGPFNGNLKVTKFDTPRLEGNADGTLDLSIIHSLFGIPSIQMMNGSLGLQSDFVVVSLPNEDQTVNYSIEKCEGQLDMKNVSFQLIEDKRVFAKINGQVYLRNNEAGMEAITLRLGKSDFEVNGVFKDVVNYFDGSGNLLADVDIKSNLIRISDLGSENKADKVEQERVFMLPQNISGNVYLDVNRMDYESHLFQALKGNMTIKNRVIHFPKIAVRNGGADVRGSLTIEERSPEYFYLSSQLVSKNIRFKSLFKEWNNFRQDVITSNNIQGIAQANVSFEAPFDLRAGVVSSGIIATIGIQIDDGRLKGVKTFKMITESLRTSSARLAIGKKNINELERKLTDLKFDHLENTLLIKNSVLTIPSMSISSSALDVELSGKHTFSNQVDYRFGFRFRDLKKKEESEFGNIVDDGTGVRVFVRMYGDLSNPTIEWDKQSRKEQAKENRAAEKETVKSMWKSEFGLFKNDTTVKEYIHDRTPKDELIIEFNPTDSIDVLYDEKLPKRESKLLKKLKKFGAGLKEEEEEDFEIEY